MPTATRLWRPNRRDLLAGALGAVGAATISMGAPRSLFASGTERLRVGLIGCGGRGTGAAQQATIAHPSVRIVAMGDLFDDHLTEAAHLLKAAVGDQFECPAERRFVGANAWRHVVEADLDAVILAAAPWSRPGQFAAAIDRGLHVYCERPAAIDTPGIEAVAASCRVAKARGLVVVSGLARRHHTSTIETITRIHDGAIGRLFRVVCESHRGLPWHRPVDPSWTAQEQRHRNWVAYPDLSGGHLVEAHLDALDCALWAMGDLYPVAAAPEPSRGGLAVRYRFADGRDLRVEILRSATVAERTTECVIGSRGTADLAPHRSDARPGWNFDSLGINPWQTCMASFVNGVLAGGRGDGGAPLVRSTCVALLGRAAVEAGHEVTCGALASASGGATGII